jgi:hypothetical protein
MIDWINMEIQLAVLKEVMCHHVEGMAACAMARERKKGSRAKRRAVHETYH